VGLRGRAAEQRCELTPIVTAVQNDLAFCNKRNGYYLT
jgi:hypothetical protein